MQWPFLSLTEPSGHLASTHMHVSNYNQQPKRAVRGKRILKESAMEENGPLNFNTRQVQNSGDLVKR
jgi:hypothetical protein